MRHEQYIGFREIPHGLEKFLEEKGFIETPTSPNSSGMHVYENQGDMWFELVYNENLVQARPGEVPDWNRSPVPIVSDMQISYPGWEDEELDIVNSLVRDIVNTFDAVHYDVQLDIFYERDQK